MKTIITLLITALSISSHGQKNIDIDVNTERLLNVYYPGDKTICSDVIAFYDSIAKMSDTFLSFFIDWLRIKHIIFLYCRLKLIHYNDDLEIRLQLWDIAGQERFSSMTRAYYKGTMGAIIVFDYSNAKTYQVWSL